MVLWLKYSHIFPFTSPIVMLMRIPNGVPIYEQIISLTILLFSSVVFIDMDMQLRFIELEYLMYGKKINLRRDYKMA